MTKKRWAEIRERLKVYAIKRGQEASTYRGIVMILTAVGTQISPTTQEAIIAFGLLAAGLVGVIFSDQKKDEIK